MKLKISLVHYLNAAPLGWYFLYGPGRHSYEVIPASPATCAEQLARGAVDVGLIPSIEYQRISDLQLIPGISIAAGNEVRSVLLVRRLGMTGLNTVALDTSSRTSVILVKLLLENRMGLQPTYVAHRPQIEEMLKTCEAALIIGDAALRCTPGEYEMIDLAAAWRSWQGKPFVFAFWACSESTAQTAGLADLFQEAKAWGLARIDQIAMKYSQMLDLPAAFLEEYLRRNLDHNLDPEHVDGLQRFYHLALEAGHIARLAPIRFIHDAQDQADRGSGGRAVI